MSSFAAALAFVLEREGGYVNNPADRGGATNRGITIGTLQAWRGTAVTTDDVKALRVCEAAAIYESNYWRAAGCDRIDDDRVALCHFDAAVNHGIRQAVLFLQRACIAGGEWELQADGVFGAKTASVVNGWSDPAGLVGHYLTQRADFFRTLAGRKKSQEQFLKGWLARCRHVARECGIPFGVNYA